jgi:nucleotide-binding universal stress UspA family protein
MFRIRTLLAATDFSPSASHAVQRAALIAREHGASLNLVHVVETGGLHALLPGSADTTRKTELARETLRRLAADTAQARGVTVRDDLRVGEAFDELLRAAAEVDLVVLAHRGKSRLKHLLIGRTASRFLRCSPKPVLAVKRPPDGPYRRVLVPFDFAACAQAAVQTAVPLAAGGELHVFHALRAPRAGLLRKGERADAQRRQAQAREEAGMTARIQRSLARLGLDSRRVGVSLGRGGPAASALREADTLGADLLVAGKQGHETMARFLLGTVSSQLLTGSACDTLIVPQPPGALTAPVSPSNGSLLRPPVGRVPTQGA